MQSFVYPKDWKAWILMNTVSSALKQRELEQEITNVPSAPSCSSSSSASLPVFLGRFHHHWRHVHLIHEADKKRSVWIMAWHLTHEQGTHLWFVVCVCLQTIPHLIPARKWPRFSRLQNVFTYTQQWWHCQSESIALSSQERWCFYCNWSFIPPPIMMK